MRLYDDLAGWWPLLSPPEDYAEEAPLYAATLARAAPAPLHSILELGSGGGSNAFHLKRRFEMTLVDRSPGMLAVSRALNPECAHVEGDMRSVRLGRRFDAVFVHDAASYLRTEAEVRAACATAHAHLRDGGGVLFVPDFTRETFRESTEHGGRDGEGRALRYLCWTHDPDPADAEYVMEFAYLLREGAGPARVEYDRHALGLFPRAFWLRALEEAGFRAEAVPLRLPAYAPDEPREMFVGVRR